MGVEDEGWLDSRRERERALADLQATIDAAYAAAFDGVCVAGTSVPDAGDAGVTGGPEAVQSVAVRCEAAFQALSKETQSALIDAIKTNEKQRWMAFEAGVPRLKLMRTRMEEQLARSEAARSTIESIGSKVHSEYDDIYDGKFGNSDVLDTISDVGESKKPESKKLAKTSIVRIVLLTGFESFNSDLYRKVSVGLSRSYPDLVDLVVFNDQDIASRPADVEQALASADVFFSSLIFDFDQVEWLNARIESIPYKFIFESALELMSSTRVGEFEMKPSPEGKKAGPPPAVKKVLGLFGSGKEEDKLVGYLSFLKIGPKLLKFLPGRKVKDLRNWLTVYSYWNEGGEENVASMISYILRECFELPSLPPEPKDLVETPATGCLHPAHDGFFESPEAYVRWYEREGPLASRWTECPKAAVLLYRKHVITGQPYIMDLISCLEKEGVIPVPIFINGVEAHTIVRDQLTSDTELAEERTRDPFGAAMADMGIAGLGGGSGKVRIDSVINTIGFPLVGGPSGTMEGGRQIDISKSILSSKNVPYMVAAPLLIQDMGSWVEKGIAGLQSVVLYSLPELDGAIDSVPLGALVGESIYLVPERVARLAGRVKSWVSLRRKQASEKKIGIILYGFPPGVGATGTAALLNVPKSLENVFASLKEAGYDVGDFPVGDRDAGERIVEYLKKMSREELTCRGINHVRKVLGEDVASSLGATVAGTDMVAERLKEYLTFDEAWGPTEWGPMPFLPAPDLLVTKMEAAWGDLGKYRSGFSTTTSGEAVVAGLQFGNVFIGVQPLLGVEGDPMRLLFERDLTPHPQYAAFYKWLQHDFRADAVVHCGTHGTSEWLPGSPLGNTGLSWSDIMLSSIPNVYVYTANNPSESIIAKRRGYGTVVSHNVPPYGRSGLYKQLLELKALLMEYREGNMPAFGEAAGVVDHAGDQGTADGASPGASSGAPGRTNGSDDLQQPILDLIDSIGLQNDCGLFDGSCQRGFASYASDVYTYLLEVENRLYSEGLHVLGAPPNPEQMTKYLSAYFDGKLGADVIEEVVRGAAQANGSTGASPGGGTSAVTPAAPAPSNEDALRDEAIEIRNLLEANTNELTSMVSALNGEYILPEAGGDLLRDGAGVLPTGRNIYALDPYRMPGPSAMIRGTAAAEAILEAHRTANEGAYPETVSVALWGLDAIKTKGESVAIVLALVGARPVKEGTGRIVRFELIPLDEMTHPRIDCWTNVSGIFRDSFQNVLDLLDDLFKRAAEADEPLEMNFIKRHVRDMEKDGLENPTARLFSNPSGDYGSMVNERVGASNWDDGAELGDTWVSRNSFSYGRGQEKGTARPEILESLLRTTDRCVQQIDSVEYGLTDIQEYYANTGALKKAAESAKGDGSKVGCSIIETFSSEIKPRELEDVIRIEYRSKLLNPKWADAMVASGSGGAFEVSQRMTAMIGWGATAISEDWTWDQASAQYVFDEQMATKLREANPEAFKNIVARCIEASGRGMWNADEATLERLQNMYNDLDSQMEKAA
jgi:magnesium chelatase subunit H